MLKDIKHNLTKLRLPSEAREVFDQDYQDTLGDDPGPLVAIESMTQWLCDAQDHSATQDGGVSRSYSLIDGWASSYPETTGYIIPTMITLAAFLETPHLRERARVMLDWCVDIQLDDGGFQGGRIDASPIVPVTFNTGQILIGLAAGVKEFNAYHECMHRAARFLRDSLDDDGCWRKHPTPFAESGEKAYETHVAWGLFEAERVAPGNGYAEAGLKQVRWALSKQEKNGWVRDCCLNMPLKPLTHTLGYFLRGVLEAYKWSEDTTLLDAALLTAWGLQGLQRPDGSLAGRVFSDWTPAVDWSCLTGNVQIAACWLELAEIANDDHLRQSAIAANAFVRKTVARQGPTGINGGVKGAYPVEGDYGSFEYLNWAAKFAIDANLLELGDEAKTP